MRHVPGGIAHVRESPTGNPAFDDRFLVAGMPAAGSDQEVLTPEVQQLTPGERARLARSGSPLAVLAGVRTPQEAVARFKTLDPQRKMQLMTMFMKVRDAQRGR